MHSDSREQDVTLMIELLHSIRHDKNQQLFFFLPCFSNKYFVLVSKAFILGRKLLVSKAFILVSSCGLGILETVISQVIVSRRCS